MFIQLHIFGLVIAATLALPATSNVKTQSKAWFTDGHISKLELSIEIQPDSSRIPSASVKQVPFETIAKYDTYPQGSFSKSEVVNESIGWWQNRIAQLYAVETEGNNAQLVTASTKALESTTKRLKNKTAVTTANTEETTNEKAGVNADHTTARREESDDTSRIGPIGGDTHIEKTCNFFTNCTYSCKKDCDSENSPLKKSFPGRPNMRYTEYNCTTDVPTDGMQWKKTDGIINKHFDSSRVDEIIATCAFYRTQWYQCFGVADCSSGFQGVLTCAGAAPWRGTFEESSKGFSGYTTDTAMNSPSGKSWQSISGHKMGSIRTC